MCVCSRVFLKYKKDRESLWHRHQKRECPTHWPYVLVILRQYCGHGSGKTFQLLVLILSTEDICCGSGSSISISRILIIHFMEIHQEVSKTEHTLSCPESPPLTISGAMYSMVPQKEYALSALKQSKKKIFNFKLVWKLTKRVNTTWQCQDMPQQQSSGRTYRQTLLTRTRRCAHICTLGWPKARSGFWVTLLQKNPNKRFGHPNGTGSMGNPFKPWNPAIIH